MNRALVLAHEPNGGAARVEERLGQRGIEVDTHLITDDLAHPNRFAPFPDPTPYDLLVLPGSIRSLTRLDEIDGWIHTELDLVQTAHQAGQPILGLCFGGQVLAQALGGTVEAAPVIETGWTEIQAAPGAVNPVGPGPWLEWHHDRFTPPPGAEVLATTEHAIQLFRIGRSVGTQFHPEVDTAHIEAWLVDADDDYLAGVGIDRAELVAETRAREAANVAQCGRLVDWFLDEVAFPPPISPVAGVNHGSADRAGRPA